MEDKISFIILHYYTITDTIKCVNSIIEKIDTDNYEIIIVDNASPNNTGKELEEFYRKDNKIHIILNKENLGFSKGNNIGYQYAKKVLKCNYIVMLNNDTYLIQENFFSVIKNEYKKSHFGVMGPKIYLKNEKINRVNYKLITLKELRKYQLKIYTKLFLNYFKLENKLIKQKNTKKEESENVDKRRENVILHGCCLVFSPKYISKSEGLLEKTFLYREEELLYIQVYMNEMITVYNPELKIFHNELSSTKASNNNNEKKNRFRYKNLIKANKILEKELKKYYKFCKKEKKK